MLPDSSMMPGGREPSVLPGEGVGTTEGGRGSKKSMRAKSTAGGRGGSRRGAGAGGSRTGGLERVPSGVQLWAEGGVLDGSRSPGDGIDGLFTPSMAPGGMSSRRLKKACSKTGASVRTDGKGTLRKKKNKE